MAFQSKPWRAARLAISFAKWLPPPPPAAPQPPICPSPVGDRGLEEECARCKAGLGICYKTKPASSVRGRGTSHASTGVSLLPDMKLVVVVAIMPTPRPQGKTSPPSAITGQTPALPTSVVAGALLACKSCKWSRVHLEIHSWGSVTPSTPPWGRGALSTSRCLPNHACPYCLVVQ